MTQPVDVELRRPQFVRINRRPGAAIAFVLDGHPVQAAAGDTLLTAMLLNNGVLRRFEFGDEHRAGYCLMGACQDCWVQLTDGRRVRACTTLVSEGLSVVTGAGPDA